MADQIAALSSFLADENRENAAARTRLGKQHFRGGEHQMHLSAIDYSRWFRQGPQEGYDFTRAQHDFGVLYTPGNDQQPIGNNEYGDAVLWLRESAANQSDPDSQYTMGVWHQRGWGVVQDFDEAARWYRLASQNGHTVAQQALGVCYDIGQGVPRDHAEAAQWFQNAASQGDAESQFTTGVCYDEGVGVVQDFSEAMCWYAIAANQGDAFAQFNMAVGLMTGRGVQLDQVEAAYWFRRAAEASLVNAQYVTGICYEQGQGVPQNITLAVRWFRMAAEKGHIRAQLNMANLYSLGKGVPMDLGEAVKWFRLAAEQGDPEAQMVMGKCYSQGEGVQEDQNEAERMYRLAASQGHATAQAILIANYNLPQAAAAAEDGDLHSGEQATASLTFSAASTNNRAAFPDQTCANPNCNTGGVVGAGQPVRRCTNCLVMKYCSRECQEAHWPIHRFNCHLPEELSTASNNPDD